MINWKIIFKILGSLLFIETALLLSSVAVSLFYHEFDSLAFIVSSLITLFFAFFFRSLGNEAENSMSRRDAYLVVTLSWTIFSIFGSLPFMITGAIPHFTDAFFETISGFTTTGATIIDDVEALPHGLLFWRSMTHWIGGLGIVFFTIALLPSLVGGSVKIFSAEATGPIQSKLHPRLSTSSKWIWSVYLILTIACVVSFKLCGMGLFDSVNYSMAIAATGGFSTHNSSILYFHSSTIEYLSIFFCFVSGVNFTLLYMAVAKLRFKALFRNAEFIFYCSIILGFTAFIMFELIYRNGYELEKAFRSSLFQVVSFITTTGLFSDDAGKWPHVTWVVLAMCMFFGSCSGSTSGGLKCVRGVLILKIISNQFKQILHPNAVLPLKIDGTNIEVRKRVTLLAFLAVYLILAVIAAFVMIAAGVDNTNAITIALSCMSNVGPTLGIEIGPTMSWSILPDFAKWICSALMLVGRLEIFTVLVILTPGFWKKT